MGNQSKRLRSRPPKVGDVTKGNWYNFWDDQLIPGPGQIPLEASLEQIPLLVKAGSILPMEEEGHLTLHLPPTAATRESILYSDGGDGYG